LHLVTADHLHLVETVEQVSGIAEIDNRPTAVGRSLPETPLHTGVIAAEHRIREQRQREDSQSGGK
jgi:hypothetical protein